MIIDDRLIFHSTTNLQKKLIIKLIYGAFSMHFCSTILYFYYFFILYSLLYVQNLMRKLMIQKDY